MVFPLAHSIRRLSRNLSGLLAGLILTVVLQPSALAQTTTAPYIITQPVSLTVAGGTPSAVFSCSVGGTPTPTLQWYENGVPIPGATGPSFAIYYVPPTAAGTFTLQATNSAGTVTSAPATLTVTQGPVQLIALQPLDVFAVAGSSASFLSSANLDYSTMLQWQQRSSPTAAWTDIVDGGIYSGAKTFNLKLSQVSASMDGYQFRLTVSNVAGWDQSNPATLHIAALVYSGAYFGTFDTGGGYWALYNYGSTAKFLAFLPDRQSAIVTQLTVSPNGVLAGSDTEILAGPAAGASFSLTGQITVGATSGSRLVTGQLSGIGRSFSGAFKAGNGSATPISGDFYTAVALNGAQGKVYSIIGYGGDLLSAIVTPTTVDGLSGSVTSLDGTSATFTGTTVAGSAFALTSNIPNHTVSINLTSPSAGAQAISVKSTTSPGTRTVNFFGLGNSTSSTSRLVNLSVRASAGVGDQTLIAGFVISGPNTKPLLIRGIGPTLANYGVTGQMTNPQLKLFDANSNLLNSNDDWGGSTSLQSLFTALGAFPLATASQDAALSVTLGSAPYSAQVTSTTGQTGVALVEVYDADANRDTRLINISARNNVGTGANALIAGFVITGNAPVQLLIRGIGPALSGFGVSGALSDPELQIFDSNGQLVVANDDWGGAAALSAAAAQVGAFALNNPASKDAALLVTLAPGTYSAQVSGQGGTTGVALIEIYEVPSN